MQAVFVVLLILLLCAAIVDFAVRLPNHKPVDDGPIKCSVELIGAKGLGSALAPGAESPALKLLVHIDNGHFFALRDGGSSDAVVSYAGVPLARGRAPFLRLEAKKAVTVAVNATNYGLGIPEDLFRLMAAERQSGAAQLEIDLWLPYGLFTCIVELDGQQRRASQCYELNWIYSS
ncbi:hypothetical protein QOZ80_1BG0080860 [Eleusine coracana subsp. coracana]|nr:hypothetical protein QOZ80_1BG0080860 [Eleusine coracana subsp. coracana]